MKLQCTNNNKRNGENNLQKLQTQPVLKQQ